MMYVGISLLLAIGLLGLVAKRHVVKKIIALAILDNGVNLFLVSLGYREGRGPPILVPGEEAASFAASSVDPVPQALVLTSIVIGLGVTMLLVAFTLRLHQRTGTLDSNALNQLRG
jgi:multicomponent Na+:H+ antiporter subunit C